MRYRQYVAVTLLVMGFSHIALAQHEGGGSLTIGPGALLEDSSTGLMHQVLIQAQEFSSPGIGSAALLLQGGGLRVCTVQAGGNLTLGQPVPTPICATAGSQAIRIDKCRATIEAHGSVHADYPHTVYVGGATIDVAFTRTAASPNSDGELEITVHTAKQAIRLKGKVTGAVTMPTCNF